MNANGMTDIGGHDARFPPTLWGQVLAAQDPSDPNHRSALDDLIRAYWKPVYAYVRFQWSKDNEKAKDHTQAFFTALIEKDFLKDVDPSKGNFRAFLKAALKHFLLKRKRDEGRLKRGGGVVQVPFEDAQEQPGIGGDPAQDAEDAFDRAWRKSILEQGIRELKQELMASGRAAQWQIFEAGVLGDQEPRPTYEQMAERFGIKVTDVANHLHAVRKRFRDVLRRCLLCGLANPSDLESEWQAFEPQGS